MDRPELLLTRLDAIGAALAKDQDALALIGLGSVGTDLGRLDAYSDLDIFVIVAPGRKERYINDLSWLEVVHPITYAFLNSVHGYKLLFADGVYCELDVFEPQELTATHFPRGRFVWKRPEVDDGLAVPQALPPAVEAHTVEWLVGEALTNLYVGLGRYRRGEKLSAVRFIQGYAVDRIVELSAYLEDEQPAQRDLFIGERRYEQRFPRTAPQMAQFVQGYDRSLESALAILAFLEQHFAVNDAIAELIRELAGE
jgi:hypothetical protein